MRSMRSTSLPAKNKLGLDDCIIQEGRSRMTDKPDVAKKIEVQSVGNSINPTGTPGQISQVTFSGNPPCK
jgi:hypothetical protein